jgi:hypothetical protein
MAFLYIWEFSDVLALSDKLMAASAPGILQQAPVAIAAGSAQSAAFSGATKFIRVHADVICSVNIGTNPVATAQNARLAANQTEYFGVWPGQQIAVITNT